MSNADLDEVTTRELLNEVRLRLMETQNSTRGRDLAYLCGEAMEQLNHSILDWKPADVPPPPPPPRHAVSIRTCALSHCRCTGKYPQYRAQCMYFRATVNEP